MGQALTKLNLKMQDFKRVLELGLDLLFRGVSNNLIFSIGFQILKTKFFQMALKSRKMKSKRH